MGTQVLGRRTAEGPAGWLGHYRAWDGSRGDRVAVDLGRPHALAVVGKRGSGKSYTLGVLAEELAATDGVVPVVADPMDAVGELPGARRPAPTVRAGTVPPRAWPALLGLDPEGGPGALVWRAASERSTLAEMTTYVANASVDAATRRAAENHLRVAEAWDVFDPAGLDADALARATVLDLSGLAREPANAVVRAVADALYAARVERTDGPLPWLLVDEAHAFLDGVAGPALRRLLTRGRQPGVSVALATQRPAALPDVAVTQADLLVAHRLSGPDREALAAARPDALAARSARPPADPGEALVVDDATEGVHPVRVRERRGDHGGAAARACGRARPSD